MPPPSIPCLHSIATKTGDEQTQARLATATSKPGFDGGEPQHGTDGVGRVGGQDMAGGEPQMRTHGGGDPQMRTDAGGDPSSSR
jgi:hypothetical protein